MAIRQDAAATARSFCCWRVSDFGLATWPSFASPISSGRPARCGFAGSRAIRFAYRSRKKSETLRWYLQFPISYRDLERMLADRGVSVDHTTVSRWTQRYAPEIDKRTRPHLQMTNGSWRVDETYIKVKDRWTYLYRAVDSRGQTIDFLLSGKRDAAAARRFFRKALKQSHTVRPRTITVDKNPAYPSASKSMKKAGELSRFARLRQVKYLNNIVEQDHRRIKRLVRPGLGFKSMSSAQQIISGYEIFAMIRKGPVKRIPANDMGAQQALIASLFAIGA